MKIGIWLLLLLPAACMSVQHKEAETVNPYLERFDQLTRGGIEAMERERFPYAERLFQRALAAAQLADDGKRLAWAWYNLGLVRSARAKRAEAVLAWRKSADVARREGVFSMQWRARLALILSGEEEWQPEPIDPSLPADVHLMAAQAAYLKGIKQVAEREYKQVIVRAGGDRRGLRLRGRAHFGLALLHKESDNLEEARRHLAAAMGLFRRIGDPRRQAHALVLAAELETDPQTAKDELERARAIFRLLEDRKGEAVALAGLVRLAKQVGDETSLERYGKALRGLQSGQKGHGMQP